MQLRGLEIYGFKSFADRTKFAFDSGITGIVGPNGCGKSNIVDAIRWVLGEQKTKNLRSDKMESVIFNGTNMRKKANFAEVSLTFENTKNILPTEYTTVTITRKLYRTGDSEYLINHVQCRLKDINDLFMDTGVSSDSYAIIELKMVDQMLTNKDDERRRFFEEASGISKYKIRKKQTLKKLEETDTDLVRVEDLLAEIEKNLKNLEKQAKRTQKYFEVKEIYRKISAQYAYLKLQNEKKVQIEIEGQVQEWNDEIEGVNAEMALMEAKLQAIKKELIDNEQVLADSQNELNKHLRFIQEKESQRNVKNERLKYLNQRQISLTNQMETDKKQWEKIAFDVEMLKNKSEGSEIELNTQKEQVDKWKAEAEKAKQENEQKQANLREQEKEHRELEAELRNFVREKDMQGVRLKSLESELARAEEDRISREGDLDEFFEKRQTLTEEVEELDEKLKQLSEQKRAHEELLKSTENQVTNLKDEVYKRNRVLDAKQNEYNLTKSLVDKLEGFPESVKYLKKNVAALKDTPLLSDIFACKDEYKAIIEQYLEPYLSYYVVDNQQDATDAIELLAKATKGRANFFLLDELNNYPHTNRLSSLQDDGKGKVENNEQKGISALSLIDAAEKHQSLANFLLGNVFIIEEESEIPQNVTDERIFLAKNGKTLRRKFVQSGGSMGIFDGKRLGRAKNLENLSVEIAELNGKLKEEKETLAQASKQFEELRKVRYDEQIQPLNRKLIEKQRDVQLLTTREKEHREFIARVGLRTDNLKKEVGQIRLKISELTPEIEGAQVQLNRLNLTLSEERAAAQEILIQYNTASANYNQANIKFIQLTNGLDNLKREIAQKDAQAQTLATNEEKNRQELTVVKKDIDELVESNFQDDAEIVEMHEKKKVLENQTDKYEQMLAQTKINIRKAEEEIEFERKKRETLQSRLQRLKDQLTEVRLQITSLRERMSVEFEIDVETIDISIFEKNIREYNLETIESQLFKVRNQVQTFGEINPMAIEAFTEMKERYDFIQQQCADLREAKQLLLDTIAEIDGTAKEKFMATFVEVRKNFQTVFRHLFTQDDTCDLLLTNPDNPLESEIDIMARPKGKRPLSISQLSGGEKTLTAVALLFSIYLIKPAPFCIFDEVDAPLDDANIDKFNNIIRDFSKDSQFIIVTHNKRTMTASRVIYGITMEDTGVSRVLPVNLEMLNLN